MESLTHQHQEVGVGWVVIKQRHASAHCSQSKCNQKRMLKSATSASATIDQRIVEVLPIMNRIIAHYVLTGQGCPAVALLCWRVRGSMINFCSCRFFPAAANAPKACLDMKFIILCFSREHRVIINPSTIHNVRPRARKPIRGWVLGWTEGWAFASRSPGGAIVLVFVDGRPSSIVNHRV